jgi:hypothetical protein
MPPKKTVTSDRLKVYLDAKKNDSLLIGDVDRWLQKQPNDRDYTYLHPSDMARPDFCARAAWFEALGHARPKEAVPLRSNLIFAEGHDIHAKWQRWCCDMGILFGAWECVVCEAEFIGWSNELPVIAASGCAAHRWTYREVPLADDGLNIRGHADGIINPTGDEPLLLEVKSVGPGTMRQLGLLSEDEADEKSSAMFSRITHPAKSHIIQTQIYMRLARQWWSQVGPITRAVIVYEHKADQQVREFVITYSDRWTDELFDTAKDIQWAIDNEQVILCARRGCQRCKPYEEAT